MHPGGPTEPPGRPENLTGTANSDGSVTLSWESPDDDSVTGYQILRRRPTQGEDTLLVYVEDTGNTATTYTDANVSAGIRHVYRVKAISTAGLSQRSNYVNVTPLEHQESTQNTLAAGQPTIVGTVRVGETLTADTTGIVSYSYQWIRNDWTDDTDIAGATWRARGSWAKPGLPTGTYMRTSQRRIPTAPSCVRPSCQITRPPYYAWSHGRQGLVR